MARGHAAQRVVDALAQPRRAGLGEAAHGRLEARGVRDDVAPGAGLERCPTVITTGSKTSKRRVTIVCSAVTISAVAAIGSLRAVRRRAVAALAADDRRRGACEAAISGPGRLVNWRVRNIEEKTCMPYAASARRPAASSTPSSIIAPGAVPALLAGLEHEHHVARAGGRGAAASRRAPPIRLGGVQVVPAGVHRAVGRGEVQPGLLGDRQRVHVAAQQHGPGRRVAGAAAQHGRDRVVPVPVEISRPSPSSSREHLLLGARQVEPDLRVRGAAPGAAGQVVRSCAGRRRAGPSVLRVRSGQVVGRVRQLDRRSRVAADQVAELVAEVGDDVVAAGALDVRPGLRLVLDRRASRPRRCM